MIDDTKIMSSRLQWRKYHPLSRLNQEKTFTSRVHTTKKILFLTKNMSVEIAPLGAAEIQYYLKYYAL